MKFYTASLPHDVLTCFTSTFCGPRDTCRTFQGALFEEPPQFKKSEQDGVSGWNEISDGLAHFPLEAATKGPSLCRVSRSFVEVVRRRAFQNS